MPISQDSPASPDIAPKTQIIDRIEREAGVPDLANILTNRLAPTDLQSLLLEVYGQRAKRREPRALLEDQVSNRFIRPSTTSPARLLDWDRVAFSRLPKVFQPIELSPVCPLGTVSALSPISQDWTVSTIRNTEVVSDSTNVLALEGAISCSGSTGARAVVRRQVVAKFRSAQRTVRRGIDYSRNRRCGCCRQLCSKNAATTCNDREQEPGDGGDVKCALKLFSN